MKHKTLPDVAAIGSFDAYMNVITKIPTLTVQEEIDLIARYQDNNDAYAEHKLIISNLRFVAHIARGYDGYGLPIEDLIQEGSIGLMTGLKKFDRTQNIRLVAYVVFWIKHDICEYVLKNWRTVRVATTKEQRTLFFKFRSFKPVTGHITEEQANDIAQKLKVRVQDVYEMEKRLEFNDVPFDLSDSDDDEDYYSPSTTLGDYSLDPAKIVEEADWKSKTEDVLLETIFRMKPRDQDIMFSRWLSDEGESLQALATKWGVTHQWINQIEIRSIEKLKKAVSHHLV